MLAKNRGRTIDLVNENGTAISNSSTRITSCHSKQGKRKGASIDYAPREIKRYTIALKLYLKAISNLYNNYHYIKRKTNQWAYKVYGSFLHKRRTYHPSFVPQSTFISFGRPVHPPECLIALRLLLFQKSFEALLCLTLQ